MYVFRHVQVLPIRPCDVCAFVRIESVFTHQLDRDLEAADGGRGGPLALRVGVTGQIFGRQFAGSNAQLKRFHFLT